MDPLTFASTGALATTIQDKIVLSVPRAQLIPAASIPNTSITPAAFGIEEEGAITAVN